ncbi:MAG TPA: STAS/SEC14 domain-containing protein [Sandaracinaceae bacterium LLY-WYZ-13_1]|nr:STAS/SEC14 domain-containing protein [Sandaracinaceae bacterium LLY-WYZ-13_1]
MHAPAASLSIDVVELTGHLTCEALDAALAGVEPRPPMVLVVDCRAMTGYDAEARRRFVEWHREHRDRIAAVAVVTEKRLWHMIVSAMSLASGQRMRAFDAMDQARAWAAAGG